MKVSTCTASSSLYEAPTDPANDEDAEDDAHIHVSLDDTLYQCISVYIYVHYTHRVPL